MKRGLKITLLLIIAFVLVVGVAIAILIHNVNKIIKHELESALGEGFSVRKIDLRWGRVEAFDISSFRTSTLKTLILSWRQTIKAIS